MTPQVKVERRWIGRYGMACWSTVVRCGKWGKTVHIIAFPSRDRAEEFAGQILTVFSQTDGGASS